MYPFPPASYSASESAGGGAWVRQFSPPCVPPGHAVSRCSGPTRGSSRRHKPSDLPVRPRPRFRVATGRSGCSHRFTGRLFPCKVCHNMGVPWYSPNRCIRMQDIRPNHRRAAHQSKPAGRAHAPADYPFGAKSRYGPTVTSIRHPEPYEGRPATIDPMPVPLQRAAVSVPRTCPQHGQSAIVSPWQLVQ